MDIVAKVKKLSQLAVLLLIVAFSAILLSSCGNTPPPGSSLTITPWALNPGDPTKSETFRVDVIGDDGIPIEGVTVSVSGVFTSGQPSFTPFSATTNNFGYFTFVISAATYTNRPLSSPVMSSATSTTGGSLADGSHGYAVTAHDLIGETTYSNILSATTATPVSSVTIKWTAVSGASNYNIYRNDGGGLGLIAIGITGSCSDLTNECSFTDNGSVATPGSPQSGSNTTGKSLNTVKGTLIATTGALMTTANISF